MERRCQEVINRCFARGAVNPIRFMHDVGAGGLSNAIPELLHDSDKGGIIDLGKVPCDDPSLSPMQLWCNESQERYVLGIAPEHLAEFRALCERERCPFAAVGIATDEERLIVAYGAERGTVDAIAPQDRAIDMPMDLLFGKPPKIQRDAVAPIITSGNTVVVLASTKAPLSAMTFAEVLATSDLPHGVINILTGKKEEIAPWMASHMDIDALDISGLPAKLHAETKVAGAENLKRIHSFKSADPGRIIAFMEAKTVWHPIGL